MSKRVTVLAPCFNESEVVAAFTEAVVPALHDGWELLFVDDGSTDGTDRILAELTAANPSVGVVTHETNRGLGAALRTGFEHAAGDVIVTIDADLSHPIGMIDDLAEACADADAVFASRFVSGGSMEGVPFLRRAISGIGNKVFRMLFRVPVRDMTTGFRAYRSEAIRAIGIASDGFEVQLEITVKLARAGCRMVELPLPLKTRAAGRSKMRYLRLVGRYGSLLFRLLFRR